MKITLGNGFTMEAKPGQRIVVAYNVWGAGMTQKQGKRTYEVQEDGTLREILPTKAKP